MRALGNEFATLISTQLPSDSPELCRTRDFSSCFDSVANHEQLIHGASVHVLVGPCRLAHPTVTVENFQQRRESTDIARVAACLVLWCLAFRCVLTRSFAV